MSNSIESAASVVPACRVIDTEPQIDMKKLRAYRMRRMREQLASNEIDLCIVSDPINTRYATGYRNFIVFQTHLPSSYLFLSPESPAILHGEKSSPLETIDECRPAAPLTYFNGGPLLKETAKTLCDQVEDYLRSHGGGGKRVAVERFAPSIIFEFARRGFEVVDATGVIEEARLIKSPEEILCMNYAISVGEIGIARMREALRPGLTEEALWAVLHEANISLGGEWIECRLLSSGNRTNPWLQEASSRVIRAGELVGFDTDMVGPFGYCADISRTFYCGPGKLTAAQRDIYKLALEELQHNTALVKAGLSYREFSEKAFKVPQQYVPNRYTCIAHGIGMCDEYPKIYHAIDWNTKGYDGVLQAGMTICMESYIGAEGGTEGVKLEEQILVTEKGCKVLSTFPFEDDFLR